VDEKIALIKKGSNKTGTRIAMDNCIPLIEQHKF
jgi:hypothetical protein